MTKHRRVHAALVALACLSASRLAWAAATPVQSAQKDATGVTLKMQTGILRLEVCDDRTIHVTASATDKLPEKKEFVVIQKWNPIPFDWREDGAKLSLRTKNGGVDVDRATGAVT